MSSYCRNSKSTALFPYIRDCVKEGGAGMDDAISVGRFSQKPCQFNKNWNNKNKLVVWFTVFRVGDKFSSCSKRAVRPSLLLNPWDMNRMLYLWKIVQLTWPQISYVFMMYDEPALLNRPRMKEILKSHEFYPNTVCWWATKLNFILWPDSMTIVQHKEMLALKNANSQYRLSTQIY